MRTLLLSGCIVFWALLVALLLAGCGGGDTAADEDDEPRCAVVAERIAEARAHGPCPQELP